MPGSRFAVFPLGVGLLVALTLAGSRVMAPPAARADAMFVAQEVRDDLANTGRARVIVEVRLPAPFVAEGALPTSTQVSAQRANIAVAQARVLAQLQGAHFTVLGRFETIAHVALEVEADALRVLESSPSVRRVLQDAV